MQTEQRFSELLDKYLAGQCTPQEKAVMETWFEQGGHTGEMVRPDKNRILANIRRRQKRHRWRTAAVWAGIMLAAGLGTWKSGVINRLLPARENTLAYINIQTSTGQMKRITLPDSSVVMLNANSSLSYHPDFRNYRQLRISGEAFFTVTPDDTHPFTVFTKDSIRTIVLGTSFNINCYDTADTRISVATGSVRVSKAMRTLGVLRKQESIHYDGITGTYIRLERVDAAGWTKGHWEYDNCRFRDLAGLLYNQYGITLTGSPGMDRMQTGVSVNFNKRQSAREIMDIFSSLVGCRYRFDQPQHITIY